MAYTPRKKSFGGQKKSFGGAAAATDAPIAEQVYFLSVKKGEGDFLNVGNIQKYVDSGKMTLSLNAEAVAELTANERGWINGIYVNESKLK